MRVEKMWWLCAGWLAVCGGCLLSLTSRTVHNTTLHGKCLPTGLQLQTVSKKRFIDFYVLGLCFQLWITQKPDLLIRLYQVHLLRRILEESKKVGDSRMSLQAYGFGLAFYVMAPLTLAVKGRDPQRSSMWALASVMLVCALVQMVAHHYLIAIRRINPSKHITPTNVLFKHTYFPHFWAEIAFYWCIAAWRRTIPTVLMASAVTCTLLRNALNQRVWYHKQSGKHS
eukprot:Blabericola_migrator_1__1802@NODE_148_length_12903_cov_144_651293_g129_i0_p6_GENE_NODE_148_length_12903_cov_144_651293_g129_i0NODE_148_length_12903_cov_144_651293_g129_i0_p6_ORF_typecomplete_len227_score15_41Steroid_dh/PF02544_16/2_8e14DUF1295/PF06966_12/3_4e03DUF1295/PF06966_12/0_00014EamA/PF00892_20/3e03EamA/PF00892_20/0_027EamA/PF00892_20/2e03BioY/PF02632_14/0_16DUF4149/PF13664_6/2_1e03DUF4149/PF13664_6/0_54DUF4149/PF13664_6/1_8e03_NODE_148_length_12903_cov_144_651293_g129_i071907870